VPVSVVIPTLNEEARVGATIDAAFAAGAAEVIVADGGSRDATIDVAQAHGARVLRVVRASGALSAEGAPEARTTPRARQLNLGAREAKHDAIIFLHADTLLPEGACDAVELALVMGVIFGGFRIAFLEDGLRTVAALINARTKFTREPWGDQAQFVSRCAFPGYREIPIMEDYELARRMKRAGRTAMLPLTVRTSGRRFRELGPFRTAALNWWIIVCYHAGVSPERLARWYRG
jgi:rSAM/selenodomain-associated transferase 2